jgi:hypothetical protein
VAFKGWRRDRPAFMSSMRSSDASCRDCIPEDGLAKEEAKRQGQIISKGQGVEPSVLVASFVSIATINMVE